MNPEDLVPSRETCIALKEAGFVPLKAPFDGYAISRDGSVWSFISGKKLVLEVAQNGYQRIQLSRSDGKKRQRFLVHRLVAESFIGPARGRHVNHKDGNKRNNQVENLEWCTQSENARHKARVLGLGVGTKNHRAILTENEALRIRAMRADGVPYAMIAATIGVSVGAVCHVVSRRHWRHI